MPRAPLPRGAVQVAWTVLPSVRSMKTVPPWRCGKRSGSGGGSRSNSTRDSSDAIAGSRIFSGVKCSQSKRRSTTAAATKYGTLCAAPTRSCGCTACLRQVSSCGARMTMRRTCLGPHVAVDRRRDRRLGDRVERMRAGHQLDRHVGDDVPVVAEAARHLVDRLAVERREETARRVQQHRLAFEARVRRQRGLRAEQRGQARVVFARAARVGRDREPAGRCGGQHDRLCHALGVEVQQASRGHRAAEDGRDRAVEAALHAARRQRLVDATGDLVAQHHRGEDVASRCGQAFAHRQADGARDGADVRDAAHVAVVGGRGIAGHGVDPRRPIGGQPRGVEPDTGLGTAAGGRLDARTMRAESIA